MVDEIKKNCPEKAFTAKLSPEEPYAEFLYAQEYVQTAKLLINAKAYSQAFDLYFTAIGIISNAILLDKFSQRSKVSGCALYYLVSHNIISSEKYLEIEQLREKRNIFHYYGFKASLFDESEVLELINLSELVYVYLKEIYGVK